MGSITSIGLLFCLIIFMVVVDNGNGNISDGTLFLRQPFDLHNQHANDKLDIIMHKKKYHRFDQMLKEMKYLQELTTYPLITVPLAHRIMPVFNVCIGTPAQIFRSLFVIDLPAFFVASKTCDDYGCQNLTLYDSSESSTYIPDGRSYDDDRFAASGFYSKDKICLKDNCLIEQSFVEASKLSGNPAFDGYFGLKLETDKTDTPSLVNALYEQQLIKQKIVTIWKNSTQVKYGEITFGGIDARRYNEPIVWTPFQHKTRSYIVIDNVTFGFNHEEDEIMSCASGCRTHLTSKFGIAGPTAAVNAIHRVISADCTTRSLACVVSCAKVKTFPSFSLDIGHGQLRKTFTLRGDQYTAKFGEKCYSMFYPNHNKRQGRWTLGGAFMNSFYTVFDISKNMVGFAESRPQY